MQTLEFPQDYFLELSGDLYREVRITINKIDDKYSAEIDIVYKEGRKIWQHLTILHNQFSEKEAIDMAVQYTAKYCNKSVE